MSEFTQTNISESASSQSVDPELDQLNSTGLNLNDWRSPQSIPIIPPNPEEPSPLSRQKALLAVVGRLRQSLNLDGIFQSTATEVRQLLSADRVAVYRFLPESNNCRGEIVSEDVLPPFVSALAANVEDPCFGDQAQAQKYRDGHVGMLEDVQALNLSPCYAEILARFEVRANLVVPLLQGETLWGLLCIHQCSGPRRWKYTEIEFVQEIALHLSVALQQAEFVAQLQRQSQHLTQMVMQAVEREKALAATIDKIRRSLDLEVIFTTTVQEAQQLLKADRVAIYKFNPDWSGEFVTESVETGWGSLMQQQLADPNISRNVSDCTVQMLLPRPPKDTYLADTQGGVFAKGMVFRVCPDIFNAGFSDCYVEVLQSYQARSYVIVAIYHGEDIWGLLAAFQNSAPRHWQEPEINFLVQISGQLDVAIQQAELLEQAQQRSQDLEVTLERELNKRAAELSQEAEQERSLAKVIKLIRQNLDVNSIFSATDQIREILGCDRVMVYQFAPDWSGSFVHESFTAGGIAIINQTQKADWYDTFLQAKQGWIYPHHEACIAPDIRIMGFTADYVEMLERHQIRAFISVPIFVGKKLWGLLGAYQSDRVRNWKAREERLLSQVANQIGVALQQVELLNQVKLASEKADAANRAKSQFLAHMSHELRTPLNSILGFAQLMVRDANLPEPNLEYLGIILRSGEHLLTLINDVLEMSKIEAGQLQFNTDGFNLHNLLGSLEEMLRLKAESSGLRLVFVCDPDVPKYICTDEKKLRQILINLLGNALKFTQQGQVTLRIFMPQEDSVRFPKPGICQIYFEVEDTGYGIAPADMDTLFDAFIQTEVGKRSQEGTGLGLSISKRFIEFMGGQISVTSTYGVGSIFKFSIQPHLSQGLTSEPVFATAISLAPGQPTYRILIAEDNQDGRLVMENLITPVGFEVRTAENGREAIAVWQEWQPDLIWMDMRMPELNGYEATQQIRAIEALNPQTRVKIIGLTASAFDADRTALLSAGCDDFVSKPFQSDLIFGKMAQHLQLDYVYQKSATSLKSADFQNVDRFFEGATCSELKIMPKIWLKRLNLAARAADEDVIAVLIQEIPNSHLFLAEHLQKLVENFQLDQMIQLLQPFI